MLAHNHGFLLGNAGGSSGRRRRTFAKARSAMLWLLAGFVTIQLVFDMAMERWQPVLRDPEYGYKLNRLRTLLRAQPGRPLILVLGSSRTNLGICPTAMQPSMGSLANAPLVFNFSINGAGPRLQLVTLKRLLADGIRPERIVLEVLPPMLHQDDAYNEEIWLNINRLSLADLRTLVRYSDHPFVLIRHWVRSRLLPCMTHRYWLMMRYAHSWLRFDPERPQDWRNLDRLGWECYHRQNVDAEEYRRGLQAAHDEYAHSLNQFRITPAPDRVYHGLLNLCRQERIPVLLLLMPEASQFRAWYGPEATRGIDAYIAGLSREYHIPAVDARTWMPDALFFDGHHLLPVGAVDFSARLPPYLQQW